MEAEVMPSQLSSLRTVSIGSLTDYMEHEGVENFIQDNIARMK